ncbi:MAG: tRNA guanosine(34) transglycosylase Tgt, partial [Candidatus Nomurabacteria bacterium]|nr:tRNA guanosine(34) transglycosylase Tgt [Candidatus Nomurabacteria bacterium]
MIFKIEKKLGNSLGRVGVITTLHGEIKTPAFVAVGTKATVKSLNPEQVKNTGIQVVLGNTYHLYLQPGDEIVRNAGGIGKFMNWDGPTMTDSGGFQVFSLGAAYGKDISKITKITDPSLLIPERFDDSDAPRLAKIGQDGVSFKSHLDGSIHYITPEKSIQIQHNLGADIIFAFDECTSPTEDLKYQEEALERTHRWAERSLKEHLELINSPLEEYPLGGGGYSTPPRKQATPQEGNKFSPALFGIVQGGRDERLRKESAKIISEIRIPSPLGRVKGGVGFDGFGIGGSFAKEDMSSVVKWVNEILPEEKPRHLLGIGEPEDLFMGIENGVDLFDCVLPTRLGRNGTIYTKNGKIIITNTKYRNDFSPLDEGCGCYVCSPLPNLPLSKGEEKGRGRYSRAYIAHLFHGKEMLAGTLASIHNLYFITHLVDQIRQSILDDNFFEFKG